MNEEPPLPQRCVCVCVVGGGSLVQFDTIDENLGTLML